MNTNFNYYPIDHIDGIMDFDSTNNLSSHSNSGFNSDTNVRSVANLGRPDISSTNNQYNNEGARSFPVDFDFGFLEPEYNNQQFKPNTEYLAEQGANLTNNLYILPPSRNDSINHVASPISDTKESETHERPKSAHNIIEQRYRNKINDKFQVLQNSVPTLRVAARRKSKKAKSGDFNDSELSDDASDEDIFLEDLQGLEPARKLNKGTILTKSIEYIKFLELKNERMKLERDQLIMKTRMLGLSIDESKFQGQ
jgi:hypothetical protein